MVSQECKLKEQTTYVANVPIFASDNGNFLTEQTCLMVQILSDSNAFKAPKPRYT